MNKQKKGTEIDWLTIDDRDGYSWNPLWGCKFGCTYCYARQITERFPKRYPDGFAPTFDAARLPEPYTVENAAIFVCSMGELFGPWVPDEQIEAVLTVTRENPTNLFLFLTKNPVRLADFNPWPENAWVGASVDVRHRLVPALGALSSVEAAVRWISFEPLLEGMGRPSLDWSVEWIVIGAQTKPTRQPERRWVANLVMAACDARAPVFMKHNLDYTPRLQQHPTVTAAAPVRQLAMFEEG